METTEKTEQGEPEVETAEQAVKGSVVKAELVAGDDIRGIVPRSIEEVFRLAEGIFAADLAPDSYVKERGMALPKAKAVSRIAIGLMKALEVGFPPITGLGHIAIINNRPCIYGEGAVALIQSRRVLEKMTVEEIGEVPPETEAVAKFADTYGIRVTLWRRGQSQPYRATFTVGDAKRAHLWLQVKREPWINYPKRQMKWRAFSHASKDGFADCLAGLAIREELEDLPAPPPPTDTGFLEDAPTGMQTGPTSDGLTTQLAP